MSEDVWMLSRSRNYKILSITALKTLNACSTMLRTVVFLSMVVLTVVSIAVNIPLNPQASLYRDVQSIQHHAHQREITIELQPSRRCQKPTFRIRISGTSLFMPHLKKAETNKLIYTYPALTDDGVYFIEVIALLCAPYNPEEFIETCLEDVSERNNVVTLPYTFEVRANENEAHAKLRPRWVLPNTNNASLLPTRYQRIDCQDEKNGWCPSKVADLWQHDLYEWVDSADNRKLLREVLSVNPEPSFVHVCIVGDSHARDMVKVGNKLNIEGVEFSLLNTLYPREFDVNFLHKRNCTYAVITYGQWPGSFNTNRNPSNRTRYTQEMRRVMAPLENYSLGPTQVFMRSVNYNALMARQTSCPPVDYRSPILIDMYNDVLRKLCKELNVEFIDMNHIIGPMWDGALDWCHPSQKVYTAEVEWILTSVLQSSLHHKRSPQLYPMELIGVNATLVRYKDSGVVYLNRNGLLTSFPNGNTLYTMGYEFEDVQHLPPSARKGTKLGPPLPSLS